MKFQIAGNTVLFIGFVVLETYSGLLWADWSNRPPQRYGNYPPKDIDQQIQKKMDMVNREREKKTKQEAAASAPSSPVSRGSGPTRLSTPSQGQAPAQTYPAPAYPGSAYSAPAYSGQAYSLPGYPGNVYNRNRAPWDNGGANFSGPWNSNGSNFSMPWNSNRSGFTMPWNGAGSRYDYPGGSGSGFSMPWGDRWGNSSGYSRSYPAYPYR